MKFLVVEDEYASRRIMATLLGKIGSVDDASDGSDGVDLFRSALADEAAYSVIFLDIMMPGMDGHETLAAIRTIERELGVATRTPVVVTTSLEAPRELIPPSAEKLVDGYLAKPVRWNLLCEVLNSLGIRVDQ